MFAVFAGHGDVGGDDAAQLDDVGEVVLVPGVVVAGVGLEQVVTGGHLEGHARGRPDVGRGTVPSPEEDLQTPVLSGLDVVSEMVVLGITLQLALLSTPH